MVQVPQNIVTTVKKYSTCPDAIWEGIVYNESNFNPGAIGDGPSVGGFSYGLFQLHVGVNGATGQGNTALTLIEQRVGLTGQDAINYLLQHVDIQAEVGMKSINEAWNALRNSYSALDRSWWLEFCGQSGHPGGGPNNGTTQAYVDRFMRNVVTPNLFGIQQVQSGAGADAVVTVDETWLQVLNNHPPHQPCNIVWRRTCPGAKAVSEGGMDLDSPKGTKVYALGDGHVIGAGYFWHPSGQQGFAADSPGYGVVTVRTTMPDGTLEDLYYQHIQISPSIILCGQTGGALYHNVIGPAPTNQPITKGQLIGTNVIGEVEVGFNADWGGIWGTNHPSAWVDDPEDMIRSLMNTGGGSNSNTLPVTTGFSQFDAFLSTAFEQTHTSLQTVTQIPGLGGPVQIFDNAQKFKPFAVPDDSSSSANWFVWGGIEQGATYPTRLAMGVVNFFLVNTFAFIIRSIFTLFAIVIIIALIINLVSKQVEESEDEIGDIAPLAMSAAAL